MTEKSFDLWTQETKTFRNGCFISIPCGFILLLFAIALSLGVGVLVYFTTRQDLDCHLVAPKTGIWITDDDIIKQEQYCTDVAISGSKCKSPVFIFIAWL